MSLASQAFSGPLPARGGERRPLTFREANRLIKRAAQQYGLSRSACEKAARAGGLVTPEGFLQQCRRSCWLVDHCQCVNPHTGTVEFNCRHCRGTGRA
ncbi:hypothetical protein D3875_03040 [Deinococcus cavernae]|uniref:Uncharacterized protein n=1 Tax=Deinococcus cavernae TaxID=2320857 RepID=A0A418VFX0_9DEIO|nr:hypothetical protein [Deinococcus cavernae]RJF74988.1 hypothetical protein D3875_03040 [Deinococcus cavernae]